MLYFFHRNYHIRLQSKWRVFGSVCRFVHESHFSVLPLMETEAFAKLSTPDCFCTRLLENVKLMLSRIVCMILLKLSTSKKQDCVFLSSLNFQVAEPCNITSNMLMPWTVFLRKMLGTRQGHDLCDSRDPMIIFSEFRDPNRVPKFRSWRNLARSRLVHF